MTIDTGLSRGGPELPQGSGMGGGIVAGVFSQAEAMRPTVYGDRWAIVAGHPLVSEIGAEILRRGGNAIDAGVAAGFASNVIEVEMCNLGGIAPILVRESGAADVHAVAGVGVWGADTDLGEIAGRHGGSLPLGGVPCIVPGAVSGWLTALERFGTLSLRDVIEPAIRVAADGFPLDPRAASHLDVMGRGFRAWESSRAVYRPDDRPLAPGDRLRQPALARTMQTLADAAAVVEAQGGTREEAIRAAHDAFYRGPIAETIVGFVRERGGTLRISDLADFRAEVSPAPSVPFGDWDVHVPPTWSQGPIIAQALGILERRGIRGIRRDSPAYAHEVVEALKLAFGERERAFGDPRFTAEGPDELLSPDHLDDLAAMVGHDALPNVPSSVPAGPRLPSTTSIVVVDEWGGAFAASPSDTIDGAPVIPDLGIICSPRGVQSRLIPGHPNAVRPGGRPCVTPASLIALPRSGDPHAVWAAACPGGDVIVQALVQVVLEMDVYGRSAQEAVEAPRLFGSSFPGGFHPHPVGDGLVFLEEGFGPEVEDDLQARGHTIVRWPANEFDAGSVQTIVAGAASGGGRLLAAGADSRRTAYAYAR